MTLGSHVALVAMVLYLFLLFGVAQFAVRRCHQGRSIVSNPYAYSLVLCVYVTAWTFYGAIGRAATTGLEFLPIYLGPALAMLLGWFLLRKIVAISKQFRLNSISDFISFRYGRSYAVGAIVAIFSLLINAPYVALQLIAISNSLEIVSGSHMIFGMVLETKLIVAALLGVFAVIFGASHLDPVGRQEGLLAAVAFESLVKLSAFLAAGIYITYGIFGGYGQILQKISAMPVYPELVDVDYPMWFTLTVISFFAILFLPRQYHAQVVFNYDEGHIRKAMLLFPLYLLLMNIFVPAIAWGGLILGTPGPADFFMVSIPCTHGMDLLALVVFLGGLSAATSMILVASVAVGTMLLNDVEMPYLLRHIGGGRNMPTLLLNIRRLNILLVVALGYLYSLEIPYRNLAEIGTVAFLGASQLAPAALGGLYWKRGSREGAIVGMTVGFLLWIYTALIPSIGRDGWLYQSLISSGPLGLAFLKPTSLFGSGLDLWTNSMFWSLLFNISLYILVSLASKPSPLEANITDSFLEVHDATPTTPITGAITMGTVDELEDTLARYIGGGRAKLTVDAGLARLSTTRERIDARQLLILWTEAEKILTGSVGAQAAKIAAEERVSVKPVVESTQATKSAYELKAGAIYIVHEKAFEVFTDQINHGIEGLCLTVMDPDEVRRRWGIKETPIIQITKSRNGDGYISSTNLPLLFLTIRSFVESSKNSIVLIDSIEYLVGENTQVVPRRDVVDFVYHIETLFRGSPSRLTLHERPKFVHAKLGSDVNEVRDLLFALGPLGAYLLKIFFNAMLSKQAETVRMEILSEANSAIKDGSFFEGMRIETHETDQNGGPSCDPDMVRTVRDRANGNGIMVPDCLVVTRRDFFMSIRKLGRIIRRHGQSFDLMDAIGGLIRRYGRSPYELELIPGTTYVIEGSKPARSLELFRDLVNHGMDGLCISRYNPETLHERFGVPSDKVIWMTQRSEVGYRTVDPTNFPRLSSILSDFLQNARYPVVLIEGLGYLITQSNYETVLRFIQSQRDDIALRGAVLMVHIDPLSLDTKELHRLESEMEHLVLQGDFLNTSGT